MAEKAEKTVKDPATRSEYQLDDILRKLAEIAETVKNIENILTGNQPGA